eukprot:TRINITY_DN19653_c0_g2_i1.p1 TRINITY_DN19653_c0_g2~~TRINITY_DN19653_c0_g2_i1.p1  ORF type:complete len:453 (+),score=34.27 TRINITY_DN19653_c0_g2_i1:61-1419(+)
MVTAQQASSLAFCLVILLLLLRNVLDIEFMAGPSCFPKFQLMGRSPGLAGRKHFQTIWNEDGEGLEQVALYDFLRAGDTVVNVGADAGTSCIFIERLLQCRDEQQTGSASQRTRTLCVEPNTLYSAMLHSNFKNASAENIRLMHGVVADKDHCPVGVPPFNAQDDSAKVRIPASLQYADLTYKVQQCYGWGDFKKVAGRTPSVLFTDCEGCLLNIFSEFRSVFSDPSLQVIIYERDGDAAAYEPMEAEFVKEGFIRREANWVWVWTRRPPYGFVRVWGICLWVLLLVCGTIILDKAVTYLINLLFQRWKWSADLVEVPIWRLLVLIWLYPNRATIWQPFGIFWRLARFPNPFVAADVELNMGTGLSNYLYMYPAIIGPLAIKIYSNSLASQFLCLAVFVSSAVLGFMLMHIRGLSDKSTQPEQSIWQITIVESLILACVAFSSTKKTQSMPR